MSRITRQEMKRDEVLETATRVFSFFTSHKRGIAIALSLVAVAIVAIVAALLLSSSRRHQANKALAEAIEVYGSEVGADASAPAEPEFASEELRNARARELFESVVNEFGSTRAAAVARGYLGTLAARSGDLEQARAMWRSYLESSGSTMMATQVQLNLLALEREAGRYDEVVTELQAMLASDDGALPEVVALDQLAVTLEEQGKKEEAREVYQRIVDEHPGSAYALRAQQQLGSA